MSGQAPLISIITVTYNNLQDTLAWLTSVQQLSYPNYEVIVVDNASSENPERTLKEMRPDLHFIRSEKNLGFAGGNNLGIKAAKGEYYFLVNNDTVLETNTLEALLEAFKANSNTGIISPLICYFDSPDTIQYAGYTEVNALGRNSTVGQHERWNGQYPATATAYPHGAAMFTSKQAVEQAGLMPELYFLYYEELDWAERMKAAGLRIQFTPKVKVLHKESATVGQESPLKTYYLSRNRIWFMRRNRKGPALWLFIAYTTMVVTPIHKLKYLFSAKFANLKAFLRALRDGLFKKPA